ncbi:hypothetical protein CB0940_04326 [Lecanosticta acicola]|uniref:C2H2-type domain-containing protein n=1 Tax=Lecanosticta acicola TaxID=111012 RepID=A0AAI9ED98_9PEZI|nr:hypothetical protein CB0940_04326 [Lecanosticta acicola]
MDQQTQQAHAAAGAPQLSFDDQPSFIDNNAWSPHEELTRVPSLYTPEPALLGPLDVFLPEPQHFADAIYDELALALYDASYLIDSHAPTQTNVRDILENKTEETKPALHVATDCKTQSQPWTTQGLTPTAGCTTDEFVESPLEAPFQRTSSKRQRERGDKTEEKVKTKRNKKAIGGFPCQLGDCDKSFDRQCDLEKHQKHKHTAKRYRPYECKKADCFVRFCWPKDVRRHMLQVHKTWLPATEPISPTVASRKASMGLLTKTLLMFRKLHLRTKCQEDNDHGLITSPVSFSSPDATSAPPERFIMVTYDKQSFREVDVTALTNDTHPAALIHHVIRVLGLQGFLRPENALLSKYHRTLGFERPLSGDALVGFVSQNADAEGTLKLQLSVAGLPSTAMARPNESQHSH